MTRSTSEHVEGARERSKPTFQYTRKSKDKTKSTHAKTRQGQRLATYEEEDEQHKTSSSSKSGSREGGEQGQNEEAYEGSDDGRGGGHDNINVYYSPSEPAGGSREWGRGEGKGSEPTDEYPQPHQMASSPWITSSDSSYGYGQQYGDQFHDPSSEYGLPQQYGGYGGPSHGYGQQQYGVTPPQVQPPYEYPQLQVMAPSSNYGEGPITPRAGQGFFHFDVAQYYRQSQNNDEDEDLEPARHSTWN